MTDFEALLGTLDPSGGAGSPFSNPDLDLVYRRSLENLDRLVWALTRRAIKPLTAFPKAKQISLVPFPFFVPLREKFFVCGRALSSHRQSRPD